MTDNSVIEKICNFRENLDAIIKTNASDILLKDSIISVLEDNKLSTIERIKEDYVKKVDKDRLLRIGIVGPVKAGKSSLLNSLFFNGKDYLPKAATPMTAALTEMTYGEDCEINIEFFTDNDVEQLKKMSEIYEHKFSDLTEKYFNSARDEWLAFNQPDEPTSVQENEWREQAKEQAKSELETETHLSGSYEQYQSIINSKTKRKKGIETIKLRTIDDLNGKLEAYVGSSGCYTPFTSRVSLQLPVDELKNIIVIDTPGFNDPVPSRNDRAIASLGESDVVFILSPSGHFLSKTDKNIIAKITKKEGIHELFVIPSQIDTQLFNKELEQPSGGDLLKTVDLICEKFTNSVQQNLGKINDDGVFDELIKHTKRRMYPTSGICEAMAITISEKASWDSNKKTVWENLTKHFKDYFSDNDIETSKSSLHQLGNINPIKEKIEDVKERKNEIFNKELENFEKKYDERITAIKDSIKEHIEKRKQELEAGNISQKEKQLTETKKAYEKMLPELNEAFENALEDWYADVKTEVSDVLRNVNSEAKEGINQAEGSYEYNYTTGHLWWKEYHTGSITTANLSKIKNSIKGFINDFNDLIPDYLEAEINSLIKRVVKDVQPIWNEYMILGNVSSAEFRNKVRSTLRDFNLVAEDVSYKGSGFSFESYSTRLEDSEAEECLDKASEFVKDLEHELKETVSSALKTIKTKCSKNDFGKTILEHYLKQLEKEKAELEKPKLALENFKRISKEIEDL